MEALPNLVDRALEVRAELVRRLHEEGTDCWRVFHGAAEGREGLAIDRYGALVLVQGFREPLDPDERAALEALLARRLDGVAEIAFVDRTEGPAPREDSPEHVCRELGSVFLVRARHRGKDPWLFLDLRAGRRRLRELARGRSVLNLFAYTCSAGVTAARAGADGVWNVDFARSALEIGRRNAELNGISMQCLQEDCLPVMRQLAGLPVKGRGSSRPYLRVEPRVFDVVFLDPPTFSTGPFGAVDVVRDYPSLFKPALLATAPGGTILATNHEPSVAGEDWVLVLERCAEKAGQPLAEVELLGPEADFPSRDGRPPLKIAVCRKAP